MYSINGITWLSLYYNNLMFFFLECEAQCLGSAS